jgi:putative endonuclease
MRSGAWVYMMSDRFRGGIHMGVTDDLDGRVEQHRAGSSGGFMARYRFGRLVYAEEHPRLRDATARQRQFGRWPRAWKIELIEARNPDWEDLSARNIQPD